MWREQFKIGPDVKFSQLCCQFLAKKEKIGDQKSFKSVLMCQGQIGKISLLSPVNPIQYGLFLKHYGMGGIMASPPCNFGVS